MLKGVPIPLRRALVVLGCALVCGYALSVLLYVRFMPDVGLRCAFTPELTEVFPGYQEGSAVLLASGEIAAPRLPVDGPQRGDAIVELAGRDVKTWPGLLRTLNEIGTATPLPVGSLEQPEA